MKTFSPNVTQMLALDEINIAYLVKLETPLVVFYETTAPFDITIPGLGVFSSNSSLSDVDDIRMSKAVDRAIYKITYIDPEFQKRALFEVGLTGSKVTIYVCFFNVLDIIVDGIDPGEPFTDPEDLIIAYHGTVDTQGYTIDPDEGVITAVIECASPMAALDLSKPFFTSRDSLKQVNPIDTAFDQVTSNIARATLLWGKK
jgi:hypothetical protein